MKAVVFYFSLQDREGRDSFILHDGTVVYLRAEVVHAKDLMDALDMAQPQEDERVMNTHEL